MKIKLTFPYRHWNLIQQLPLQTPTLGEDHFFINDDSIDDPDAWFVFEDLEKKETVNISKENTFLFTAEPPSFKKYPKPFTDQFGNIITCQRKINHPNKHFFHQGHPWFLKKSHDQLLESKKPIKTKFLSIVVSNKQITEGHKKRYAFCMKLKERFPNDIDLFGRGINDFDDKWEVLRDYKYSIAIENELLDDWFTEKLYDCLLAGTTPLYFGCPNLSKYFPDYPVIRIDLDHFDETCELIEELKSETNQRLYQETIDAGKDYIHKYSLFPLMSMYSRINTSNNTGSTTISPLQEYSGQKSSLLRKFYQMISAKIRS